MPLIHNFKLDEAREKFTVCTMGFTMRQSSRMTHSFGKMDTQRIIAPIRSHSIIDLSQQMYRGERIFSTMVSL